MSENKLKLYILGGAFLLTLIVTLLITRLGPDEEVSYTVLGDSSLPVIRVDAGICDINTLYGYTGEINAGQVQKTVCPVNENNTVKIKIFNTGENITGIYYEIRSIDGSNLIVGSSLDSWKTESTYLSAEIPVLDIIENDIQYQMVIKLKTEKRGDVNYYTRIIRNSSSKLREMLEYVTDFHKSTFDAEKADKYAVNWEPSGKGDLTDLSHVDIHSSFKQFTYRNLKPVEIGEPRIDLTEIDNTIGAFRITFEIEAENETGDKDSYYVSEYISLQWSEIRFYLMAYERNMSQIFEINENAVTENGISLGILHDGDTAVTGSEGKRYTAFVNNGNLWVYSAEKEEINEIFSFKTGQELLHRLNNDFYVKVLSVDDDGNITFVVNGYVSRGTHEGKCGLSLFNYTRETNNLTETLFMESQVAPEVSKTWLDTLSVKIGKLVYLLYNNTVFAVDENGAEIIRMVENAESHNLTVSLDKKNISWSQGNDNGFPSQVQIKYLETGKGISLDAKEGEYILPKGFVEKDAIVTYGREVDGGMSLLEKVYPQYALVIISDEEKEVSRYEKPGVYIKEVSPETGKIIIKRVQHENGTYLNIDDDTLMQNDYAKGKEENPFNIIDSELKGKTYYLSYKTDRVNYSTITPGQISYYDGKLLFSESEESNYYLAYVGGELCGRYENVSEAINSIYDRMGYVTDKNGYRIWRRTAKTIGKVQIVIPATLDAVSEDEKLAGSVNALLAKAGIQKDIKEELSGKSVTEILNENLTGVVILDKCNVKQIRLFISRVYPVLMRTGDGETYLITGYDDANVFYYNPVTKNTDKMPNETAENLFADKNTRLVSYVNK